MAIASDQIPQDAETTVESFEGPIHVSFKSVKNTVPGGQRYKLIASKYEFVTASTGTKGVRVSLNYDPILHKEYEKRIQSERFWFTPEAINMYLSFISACGINPEMLREEPVDPPQFNPDGTAVTKCVYSVEDQIRSIMGATVWADIIEEQYDGIAADGVTPEKKWRNTVPPRGWYKV